MDKKHILFKLKKISGIPSEPTIVTKINKVITKESCSPGALAGIIETDPGLSTKVLRLANSSYYGLSRRVDTISRAVTVLGFNMVRDLTLTVSVFKIFSCGSKNSRIDAHGLWCHSLACAVAAKVLMGNIHSEEAQKAFMGGILHDVGKIIISNEFPQEQEQILALVENGTFPSLLKAERSVLEMDHPTIGAEVAELWQFPRVLIEP
ncbi:MAG: HDOD domain-containing protein, partial [Pseudomonadota bacterium]